MEGGPSASGASEKANGPIIIIEVFTEKSDWTETGRIGAAQTLATTSTQENKAQTSDVSSSMMRKHNGECSDHLE